MIETLDRDLRGLRDRAILLLGFAGGLRRSEIVGLDCGPDQTEEGAGWIEILDPGVIIRVRGKTGWREVEVGRGTSDVTCRLQPLRPGSSSPASLTGRCSGGSRRAGKRPAPTGLPTSTSPA